MWIFSWMERCEQLELLLNFCRRSWIWI